MISDTVIAKIIFKLVNLLPSTFACIILSLSGSTPGVNVLFIESVLRTL